MTDCKHCPDGHTPADRGSQAWNVHISVNQDDKPTRITVARSAGAHVAESDVEWIYERLNGRKP